jgi:hypothetical protein
VTSAQNAEFCEHLMVFQGTGLRVKALLDAVARELEKEDVYMGEVQVESEKLALQALVLPCPVRLSEAVARLEASLGLFNEGGKVRGLKRGGEGSGEGSEERKKQAWEA